MDISEPQQGPISLSLLPPRAAGASTAQQVLPSSQVRGLLSVSNISHMKRCYWCSVRLKVLTPSQEQAWGILVSAPLLCVFLLQPGCKAKSRPAPWH